MNDHSPRQETPNYSRLTPKEETDLLHLFRAGNKQALAHLLKAYLAHVIAVAKEHEDRGLSLMRLIAAGNIAMIKAAREFDVGSDERFVSHALTSVRQFMRQALEENKLMAVTA